MVLVKCKACSKRYDYHQHGCCPACGAYNRPPQRDRVGADGVVHHMSDADFLDNTHRRRRSQSGKVCFEQDVCFEEQARGVRSGEKLWAKMAGEGSIHLGRMAQKESKEKRGPARIIGIIISVILATNVLPLLLTMCSATGVVSEITDYLFSSEVDWDKPVEVVPARPEADLTDVPDVAVGQTFLWCDADACVTEVTLNETDEGTKVDLTLWVADPQDKPAALYRLPDGSWVETECEYVAKFSDNDYTYYFYLPDRLPGSECYILFSGHTGGVWCRSKLPLWEEAEIIVGEELLSQQRSFVSLGETFSWWGEEVRVAGVDIVEGDHVTEVLLTLQGDVAFEAPFIAYWDRGGNETMVTWCDEYGEEADGWWNYRFLLENRMDESDCWAVFSDDSSAWNGTVWVLLNG